jgi:hypothetical protein
LNKVKNLLGAITIAAVSFANVRTQGMNQNTYDLESLVDMSPQIVEGQLGGEHRTNNVTVWQFKISTVHKGNLKAAQSIDVTALDFYAVSSNSFWGNDKLKEGDRLFLFFDRARKTFIYDIPESAEIYWPAPSGLRLIVGGKALEFFQYNNPGPYLVILAGAATNTVIPTVTKFREQIREGISRMEKWKPLLEREATAQDIPALLQILRERTRTDSRPHGFFGRDLVTEKVCNRLVALHDISALTNAMEINNQASWGLSGGFDSLTGRQFLWSKIADEKQPIETRIKWASFLQKAGEGNPEEHQLKRIAELAVRPGQDPKLQATLFDNLRELQNWWRFTHADNSPDAATQSGINEAASILKSFSEKTDSEEAKYKIDLIFGEFKGEKEGIISILKFGNYDASARRLNYHYDILVWKGTNLTVEIIFADVITGKKWNLPVSLNAKLTDHSQSGGIKDVTLPKDLPSGRYQVFYEFLQEGKVVSTSRHFETDF